MQFILLILLLFFPSLASAQIPMKIKIANFEKSEINTIAVYEGGKAWVSNVRDKLYYDNGNEIVIYSLQDKTVKEQLKHNFDAIELKDYEKFSAKKVLKSLWSFTLEEKVSSYAMDSIGENFFLGDNTGFLYFYDIKKKDYKGRLKISSKPIKIIKSLNNGNIVLVNEECELIFLERVKIPFFSFLQDLRSSYRVSKIIKLEANFVSRIIFDEKQELMALISDHKNIFIIKLPTLEILKKLTEGGYIRYAEFLDNKNILYLATTAFSRALDNPFNVEAHMAALAHFFDRTGITIPSFSGNLLLRFENKKELRLYSVEPFKLLVDFGDLVEKGVEVTIAPDDKTIILYQADRSRFGFYQIR
jgi:hypothetical protein